MKTFNLEEHNKMNSIIEKIMQRDVPKYGNVIDNTISSTSIDFNVGCGEWYSIYFNELPTILGSIPILSMNNVEFRNKIYSLLNEYDDLLLSNISPSTELENSIDDLFESLWK